MNHRSLILLFVATAVVSFAASMFFLSRFDLDFSSRQTPQARVLLLATQLTNCLERKTPPEPTKERCNPVAKSLSTALRGLSEAERSQFDLYRKAAYDVIRQHDHVILFKSDCTERDVSVKTFAWALFPSDPTTLPPDRRQIGYFNVALNFDETGFTIAGSCLLVSQLPVMAIKSFSIGQVRLPTSEWLWRTDS